MIKYIKKYGSTINEQVNEIDGTYIISGVRIKKSVVTSYKRKVKEQTGKDLGQMYSDSQIAEELITYIVTKNADAELIPVSALMGGDESEEEMLDGDGMADDSMGQDKDSSAEPTAPVDSDEHSPSEEVSGTPAPSAHSQDDDFEKVSPDNNSLPV